MIKCDVCGKTTLLPETIGIANICKACFIKTGGPLWKNKKYETYDETEKQKIKIMKNAEDSGYTDIVMREMDKFFNEKLSRMKLCNGCGQSVITLKSIGSSWLCKNCYNKINIPAWRASEFEDNSEVEEFREALLNVANENNFGEEVVADINKHFDAKLKEGLIKQVDGGLGQKLKVYDEYCDLNTGKNFDRDEVSKKYAKLVRKTQGKNLLSSDNMKKVAMGLVTGNVVKTGISLATSAAVNMAVEKIVPGATNIKVVEGHYRIDYSIYKVVDYQSLVDIGGDESLGYIVFRSDNDEVMFFFRTREKKASEAYSIICNKINEKVTELIKNTPEESNIVTTTMSVADEIMKYKQLLDIGAITQEEYDIKKQQLLNL